MFVGNSSRRRSNQLDNVDDFEDIFSTSTI